MIGFNVMLKIVAIVVATIGYVSNVEGVKLQELGDRVRALKAKRSENDIKPADAVEEVNNLVDEAVEASDIGNDEVDLTLLAKALSLPAFAPLNQELASLKEGATNCVKKAKLKQELRNAQIQDVLKQIAVVQGKANEKIDDFKARIAERQEKVAQQKAAFQELKDKAIAASAARRTARQNIA